MSCLWLAGDSGLRLSGVTESFCELSLSRLVSQQLFLSLFVCSLLPLPSLKKFSLMKRGAMAILELY